MIKSNQRSDVVVHPDYKRITKLVTLDTKMIQSYFYPNSRSFVIDN